MDSDIDITKLEEACDHTGSKRVIPICGGSYCGTTITEDIYICNDCGVIYLHRYVHWAAQGEEMTDNIMPGETKHGVTFHEAAATMLKLVQEATSKEALEQIGKQATAIGTFVQYRLKQGVT